MFESCMVTRITWNSMAENNCSQAFFFFNFHLHLVNTISEAIGWLSEHPCTYSSPNSTLTRNCYGLTVLGWGEGRGRFTVSLGLILIHDPTNVIRKRIKIGYNPLKRASFRSLKKADFSDLSVNLTEFPVVAAHENETSAYCYSLTFPLKKIKKHRNPKLKLPNTAWESTRFQLKRSDLLLFDRILSQTSFLESQTH